VTSQTQSKLVRAVLTLMTASLIIIAIQSLQWRMQHDSPQFLYSAYLMDQFGYIPYRDFGDMNMPGCHILTLLLTKVFGYDDFGFRCSDLFCLAAILILTAVWTRRFGRYAAWFSVVAFGLIYLSQGSIASMQRDYLMLLPVSLSLVWLLSHDNAPKLTTSFITGVLFGFCFLIKPTAAIGLPCLVGYQIAETRALEASQTSWVCTLFSMASFAFLGFAIPIAAMVWKLSLDGSLNDFLEIANNYWPLYNAISGEHVVMSKLHTLIIYRVSGYFQFGGFSLLLFPALLGVFITLVGSGFDNTQRRVVVLISSLAVAYSLHALMGGKFWPYHWIMFVYFVVVLGSLCLVSPTGSRNGALVLFPVFTLLIAVTPYAQPPYEFLSAFTKKGIPVPKGGRVDRIADYLKTHMKPGETVQPLDWTGGAIQAMLVARARLATTFLCDPQFYHHVSQPFIQGLRNRFVRELKAARPRFIIEVVTDKPWVSGPDTTREFPELQNLMKSQYIVALKGDGYNIYEKRGP